MTTEETWLEIAKEREDLYEYLETLPESAWEQRSKRTDWTVKQLVAHIILESQYTPMVIVRYMLQARLNVNRFMDICARNYAQIYSIPEMLHELYITTEVRKKPFNISATEVLIDLWIHRQDIVQAVGGTPQLNHHQIVVMLNYITANPRSHGLKVMGVTKKLQANSYHISDHGNLLIGEGKTAQTVTARELLSILINF